MISFELVYNIKSYEKYSIGLEQCFFSPSRYHSCYHEVAKIFGFTLYRKSNVREGSVQIESELTSGAPVPSSVLAESVQTIVSII